MRTVVTGAAGFLGRHLMEALARDGGAGEALPLVGDVCAPATYETAPRADVVYHLAAKVSVPGSVADPRTAWETNVDGTLRALEWARRTDVGRFILLSSAHVYGKVKRSPIDETHALEPVSPYGASKAAAEMAARAYIGTYGLDVVIVRPFNIYGPGQPRGYLIPDILHQLRDGRELVLGDPVPIRDFTYVSDVVEMLRKVGSATGAKGRVFNVGSGEGHSVAEVVELARKTAESSLEPQYRPQPHRAGDLRELIVDNRAAREALGWAPKVGLAEGLRRTWDAMA